MCFLRRQIRRYKLVVYINITISNKPLCFTKVLQNKELIAVKFIDTFNEFVIILNCYNYVIDTNCFVCFR